MMPIDYTDDDLERLTERADGMNTVVESAMHAVNAAAKDMEEAIRTYIDVCLIARCEIERTLNEYCKCRDVAQYLLAKERESESNSTIGGGGI